jgi:hypothetical protein
MILGAQKAATSSLWALLKEHPQLCAGTALPGEFPFRGKESHFFDDEFNFGPNHYLRRYSDDKCAGGPGLFMDATPSYLRTPEIPGRVARTFPANLRSTLRFIAVLREPLARDLSYYNHERYHAQRRGFLRPTSFLLAVDEPYENYAQRQLLLARNGKAHALSFGEYNKQLKQWFTVFVRQQFLVLNFEDLIYNQPISFRRIARFLGVQSSHLVGRELPHENAQTSGRKVRMQSVPCKIRSQVAQFFEPRNLGLYKSLWQSRLRHEAPAQEPPFPRFKPSVC